MPGFIGLGEDNCTTRRETSKFGDLVRHILEILRKFALEIKWRFPINDTEPFLNFYDKLYNKMRTAVSISENGIPQKLLWSVPAGRPPDSCHLILRLQLSIMTLMDFLLSRRIWWWRHQMETFSASLAFVREIHRVPVNSPHKGQWRGALMFSLICVWINGWVNNGEAGDLRRHRGHYDVNVMWREFLNPW